MEKDTVPSNLPPAEQRPRVIRKKKAATLEALALLALVMTFIAVLYRVFSK
jgi:hypothetical protein